MRTQAFTAAIITFSLLYSSCELRAKKSPSVKNEIDAAIAIARKIPEEQRISSLKFVRRVEGIFDAMSSYYRDTIAERLTANVGMRRKDVNRYNDTIADASGEVPQYLITYVEGTYQAIEKYYSTSALQDSQIVTHKKYGLFVHILVELKDPTVKPQD